MPKQVHWDGNLTRMFIISPFSQAITAENVTEVISMKSTWHDLIQPFSSSIKPPASRHSNKQLFPHSLTHDQPALFWNKLPVKARQFDRKKEKPLKKPLC